MSLSLEMAEAVFVTAAVLGSLFSGLDLWDARKDWETVKAGGREASLSLLVVARRDVRTSLLRTAGFTAMTVGAVLFHFWQRAAAPWWLLTSGVVLFAVNAVMDSRVRSEVLLLVDRACDDGGTAMDGDDDEAPGTS